MRSIHLQLVVFSVLLLLCLLTQSVSSATYDYIVVGGGAGGAVMATRLAQHGDSVLLLDGGIPSQSSVGGTDFVADSYYFDNNGDAVFNRPLTRYDVPAFTYSATADFPGSPTPYYRLDSTIGPYKTFSKVLGGNSVHNYLVWSRITPRSQNLWNVTGWSYNDLLPYFKKIEDVRDTTVAGDTVNHGLDGPIVVTNAQVPDPIGRAFIRACANTKYGTTTDYNRPTNYEGCTDPQFNINRRGVRGGALNQYLAPTLKNSTNIRLITSALVVKVLFNRTNTYAPVAIGVQYEKDGVLTSVYARKEVILSAGAVGTIKTLLLSGIGPAAELNALGIPIIAELPVGKNMSTHPIVFTTYAYNETGVNGYGLSASSVEYAINGTGVYASVSVPAIALLKSDPSQPDIDLHTQVALSGPTGTAYVLALRLTFQRDLQLKLKTKDFHDPPFLVFHPFTRDQDVVALANAIKIFRNITGTAPANRFFGPEISPGPAYQTDAQLQAFIRNGGGQPILTHFHGGAPLGNAGDSKAVLDNRGRVKKVSGLRICDSTIIPYDIRALPTNNLIAYCEKIADYTLADNA